MIFTYSKEPLWVMLVTMHGSYNSISNVKVSSVAASWPYCTSSSVTVMKKVYAPTRSRSSVYHSRRPVLEMVTQGSSGKIVNVGM